MPDEETIVLVAMLNLHATRDLILARCTHWHTDVSRLAYPGRAEHGKTYVHVLYWTCRS